VHELQQRDLEAVRVGAERGDRRLHPRDVAVVVGAEHVDHAVVAALELLLVVGDVGGEVRRLAGRPHEHAVLVVAERRRPQPERAVRAVQVPLLLQAGERAVDRARRALVERTLGEPAVEVDAVGLERRADPGDDERDAALGERVGVEIGGAGDLVGELLDVLALVAVLGRLLAAGTGADRLGEAAHLGALVVEVVLGVDGVAREREDPG